MDFWKKNKYTVFGTFLGFIGGFLYWHYIGCFSGTCIIQSNPYLSTLYGGFFGYFMFSSFKKSRKKAES